jgi:putative tryptophan/tyrosine transport system substrate-binding protein
MSPFGGRAQPVSATPLVVSFAQEPPDALFVAADAFFNSRSAQFVTLTARERIASAFSDRAMVAAGGLMSYGADLAEIAHQVGLYTGKILKGASSLRPFGEKVQR